MRDEDELQRWRWFRRHGLSLRQCVTRSSATFTDDNDHNPQVLRQCEDCRGTGLRGVSHGSVAARDICDACEGRGIFAELEPYFANDEPPRAASVNAAGWVRCPACDTRFSVRDPDAWTGWRHKQRGGAKGVCGQRLVLDHTEP